MNSTLTYPPLGDQHISTPPPPQSGSGPCGLNGHEWHMFFVFVLLLLFVFLIALVVSWKRSEDVADMWLQATHHVQATKIGWYKELLKDVLPQHDVGTPIAPGPNVGPRTRSTVNLILATMFPSMRQRPGP